MCQNRYFMGRKNKNIMRFKINLQTQKGHLFIKHLSDFLEQMRLFDLGSSKKDATTHVVYVGVSGGMDSMALLTACLFLKKRQKFKKLVAVHLNHQLRTGSDDDAYLVKKFCTDNDISFLQKNWQHERNNGPYKKRVELGNLECRAREARYDFFRKVMERERGVFFTAHSLDDSFEWYLLQTFRSGGISSGLGIPVVNGDFRRPFLCVTRKQIRSFTHQLKIPYRDDESNEDLRFERNYIRHQVIPVIRKRYPQYLKHYARRAQRLASKLKQTRGQRTVRKKEKDEDRTKAFSKWVDPWNGQTLWIKTSSYCPTEIEQEVLHLVKRCSKAKRGKIGEQVHKAIQSLKTKNMGGPFNLSGDVLLFTSPSLMVLYKKEDLQLRMESEKELNTTKGVEGSYIPCNAQYLNLKEWEKLLEEKKVVFPGLVKVFPGLAELQSEDDQMKRQLEKRFLKDIPTLKRVWKEWGGDLQHYLLEDTSIIQMATRLTDFWKKSQTFSKKKLWVQFVNLPHTGS